MKRTSLLWIVAVLAAVGTISCNGGHDDNGPQMTNFNGLVNNLAASPSETGEPLQINGATFTFSEDPHAFDGLFQ